MSESQTTPIQQQPIFGHHSFSMNFFMLLLIMLGSLIVTLCLGMLVAYAIHGNQSLAMLAQMNTGDNPGAIGLMKFFQVMSQIGTFIVPAVLFAFLVNRNIGDYLGINRAPRLYTLLLGTLVLVASIPLINLLSVWNGYVVFPESWRVLEEWLRQMEANNEIIMERFLAVDSVYGMLGNVVLVGLVTAVAEEFFFRGLLLKYIFRASGNVHMAVWITTLVFAAIHFQFFKLLPMMLLSSFFGYVYVWTKSLWVPIYLHFFNNAAAVVVHYYNRTGVMSSQLEEIGTKGGDFILQMSSVVFITYFIFRIYKQERI